MLSQAVPNFAHVRWLRTSWAAYNLSGSGETHPAVGNIDMDDGHEIVVGLDAFPGDGGWFESIDDVAAGHVSLGWRNLDWQPFRAAGDATFPTIGRFR